MSPVSPTLVPAVSSLIRSDSPSNLPISVSADGVSVFRTTNSCVMVPALVTLNVTLPAAGVADGVTDHWLRITETSPVAAVEDAGCDDDPAAELELEQAADPTTSAPSKSPIHLMCP